MGIWRLFRPIEEHGLEIEIVYLVTYLTKFFFSGILLLHRDTEFSGFAPLIKLATLFIVCNFILPLVRICMHVCMYVISFTFLCA